MCSQKSTFIEIVKKSASSYNDASYNDEEPRENATPPKLPDLRILGKVLATIPPDATIHAASQALVPPAYEWFLRYIDSFLHSEGFRSRLESEALSFVKQALDRLGPMQRFFISIAGYDNKIAQAMPQIIEDLIKTIERLLQDPATQKNIVDSLARFVIDQRAKIEAGTTEFQKDTARVETKRPMYRVVLVLSYESPFD